MPRHKLAFLVAPLAVPLLVLLWLMLGNLAMPWLLIAVIIAAATSYAGTFLLGKPAYAFLNAHGQTAAWIAVVTGFVIGATMWLVFSILFPLSLGQGVDGVLFALTDPHSLRGVIYPGGLLGMIVGGLFWVIARPDRPSGS